MNMHKNSHQVYEIGYHIIWCTKFRNKVLIDAVEIICRQILTETCVNYNWSLEEIEIMPDHIHIFVRCSPQVSPSEISKTLKSISAVKLFSEFPKLKSNKFWGTGLWSPSTYFGTVGHISEETVRNYIQTQKER